MQIYDLSFWIAVAGAIVIKLVTSAYTGLFRAAAMVIAALVSSYVFTPPTLLLLELDPASYTVPVAALWTLTGEGLSRWVINLSNTLPSDPMKIAEIWRAWRSGK